MKFVGIMLSLVVSMAIIYMTLKNLQVTNKNANPISLNQPIEKAKNVQSSIDLSAVVLAIQTYQAQQGSLPKSLSDLVSSGLLAEAQVKNLNYDPESGKVSFPSD